MKGGNGREVVTIFEIDRIACSLTYGESPCAAVLGTTGTSKCLNSRAGCQDAANFTPETVTDRFLLDQEGTLAHYAPFVPSIEDISVSRPMSINLAGMDENAAALGTRETLRVLFRDHQHSDLGQDKYRLERPTGDASLVTSGTANPNSNTGPMTDFLVLAEDASPESSAYPTDWWLNTDESGAVQRTIARQHLLRLVSGAAAGQERRIVSYDGLTKIARVEAWDSGPLPDETTQYEVREAYDPYKRGSYWGKWLARNPFHPNYSCRAYRGFLGDSLASMRVQHYILDKIDGPNGGMATLVAKDLFSRIEAKKAVAPFPSRGELSADLTGTPSGFSVAPAGIGDQPEEEGGYASIGTAADYLAIGDEIVHVVRSGDDFTFVPDANGDERGCLDTEAKDHDEDDLVQGVFSAVSELPHDTAYRLLVDYAKIDPAKIDKALWDERAAEITDLYTGHVGKPTAVRNLLGEIERQAGFTIWPDISTGMIEFRALRAGTVSPTVDDRSWLVDGSIKIEPQPSSRVSQVWVYYGMRNPLEELDDERNYHSRVLRPDVPVVLDFESEIKYGTPAIEQIFSRWIPKGGRSAAERCGNRIFAMGEETPLEVEFALHTSRDGELELARYFAIETADIQDLHGSVKPVAMATVEIARGEFETAYRARSVRFDAETDDGVRRLFIENDELKINLRALHDLHFEAPTGEEVIEFIVLGQFSVGSPSTASFACDSGDWPTMTTPPRLIILGRVQGKGGKGGNGTRTLDQPGENGENGGPALKVRAPFILDGTGKIWSGGAGGGGGGTAGGVAENGGGGGGAAGIDAGAGGLAGDHPSGGPASNGAPGTADAGGNGGSSPGGTAGNGGGPGQNGTNGTGTFGAGIGGTTGVAIDGIAFVTFDTNHALDIRGPTV